MKNGYYTGRVGQLDQVFNAEDSVITIIRKKHNLIDFKGLVKLGIQAPVGTKFVLNGETIRIGATGIYELDYTVNIKELYFLENTEALVDYIY
jgi:hypothetical protein